MHAQFLTATPKMDVIKARPSCYTTTNTTSESMWLLIYLEDAYGTEFAIVSQYDLVSWDTIDRGLDVIVSVGGVKRQATIAYVSDTHDEVIKNYDIAAKAFIYDYRKVWEPIHLKNYYTNSEVDNRSLSPVDLTIRKTSEEHYKGDNNEIKPVLTINLTANRSTQFNGGNDDEKKRSLAANIEELKQRCRDLEIECNEYEHTLKVLTRMANEDTNAEENSSDEENENRLLATIANERNLRSPSTDVEELSGMVTLGRHHTKVPLRVYQNIDWHNHSTATRTLMMHVFDRATLVTHTLTGKPSPAFRNDKKPEKLKLNPRKVEDIVETVSRKCAVSKSLVRTAITLKCADENKLHRKRQQKQNYPDVCNITF